MNVVEVSEGDTSEKNKGELLVGDVSHDLGALYSEPSNLFHRLVAAAGLDSRVDFSHRDLRTMRFAGADLSGFDFSGSDLRGTSLRHAKRVSETTILTGAELDPADREWLAVQIFSGEKNHEAELPAAAPVSDRAEAIVSPLGTEKLAFGKQLTLDQDLKSRALWCYLDAQGRGVITEELLAELHHTQDYIVRSAGKKRDTDAGLRWIVLASRIPGVFSLGGDLHLFARLSRVRDAQGLRWYAYSCIASAYLNSVGYEKDLITIGLSQGDAAGSGFELLLSCNVLVAERRARFVLPEILFNIFPGMGAHSFLSRRVGPAVAQRMILSGMTYTAEEMHAAGVVDVLVDDGEGVQAVQSYIRSQESRGKAHAAVYKAGHEVHPVTLEELRRIADIWVDSVMRMEDADLRKMLRLASAQERRIRRAAPVSAVTSPRGVY